MQTALLTISLCCTIGAFSQNTPTFSIGTRWTYERVIDGFFVTYEIVEIVRDTVINDTLAFVVDNGSAFGELAYMHVAGDSIYFWERRLGQFQLNYDFSATDHYETTWAGQCHEEIGVAEVFIDSLATLEIDGNPLTIQYASVSNNGSFTEDMPVTIYSGIGSDQELKLQLGMGLCDFGRGITRLRCFETPEGSINFVGFPCDSTWVLTATTEVSPISSVTVYPNPSRGQVSVDGLPDGPVRYTLYDTVGRRQKEGELQHGHLHIRMPGVYLLVLDVAGKLSAHKVVIAN